ncbi:MAG TPA: HepT-like ribonuclease domain-containing protein [Nakamurella sp.]
MNRGADADQVQEMVAVARQAEQVVARGREVFFEEANVVEFLAGRMIVIELDVAADRVSDEFKTAHPGPWRALSRARDKYAHHYEDIDRGVVWELLEHRLPRWSSELAATIRSP